MKSTNAVERARRNHIMASFCAEPKPMLYEPENVLPQFDAVLWSEKKPFEKLFGFAKIVTQLGKFGNKPIAEAEKETVDFLDELAILCGVKSAIIFKFKDKLMYWKIEQPDKLKFETNIKRGKTHTTYQVPIQDLRMF